MILDQLVSHLLTSSGTKPSEFCSSSSSFATTVAVSFISMSPNILLPSGRRSKWSMLFHGTRRLGTWYGIETRPTERCAFYLFIRAHQT